MTLRRRIFLSLITGFTAAGTSSILLSLNKNKYLTLNRKRSLPFFLGWYDDMKNTDVLSKVSSKGIDILMPYIEKSGQEKVQAFLDASKNTGVKVLLEIYRSLVESENISEVKQFIRTYKNHSSVYGWYLYDEPEIKKPTPLSPDLLKKVYQAIKEEDNSKPVALVFADIKKIEPYTDAMDILMWDRYPCEEGVPEFQWVPSYQKALYKVLSLAYVKNKKFFNVVQAYSDRQSKKRLPTELEFRYMFYLSVLRGADGMLFWVHYLSSPFWSETVLYPTIEEFRGYIPAIVRGEDLRYPVQVDNSNTEVKLFSIPNTNQFVFIVVNHNHKLNNFSLKFSNKLASKIVSINQKIITKLSSKATFSTSLNPYEVRVYQIG